VCKNRRVCSLVHDESMRTKAEGVLKSAHQIGNPHEMRRYSDNQVRHHRMPHELPGVTMYAQKVYFLWHEPEGNMFSGDAVRSLFDYKVREDSTSAGE
jgi:hypothetical protein